ncbi:MAG: phosphate uptake regulator PhoU [Desulfurococcaceae archaeon TW002]
MENESEEVRKIQFTGKSTYIVSLPKKWVYELGLRKGSQVVISKRNNSLILTPKELVKPSIPSFEATIVISGADDPDAVVRKIISLYLRGYNFIVVRSRDERISSLQRTAVKELVRKKLVGTEIISETLNEIRLQSLLNYPELSVENALRRMCVITASMREDAVQALKNLDKELAREVILLDDEVDRFSFYVIRQLKAAVQNEKILKDMGLSSPQDCLGYRVIVKFVERIADHAAKIAEHVLELEEKPSESVFQKIYEINVLARSVFDDVIKSLFKRDYVLADRVISRARAVRFLEGEAVREIQTKTKQTDIPAMRMVVESIRRMVEYASDIAEIVLNMNIEQVIRYQQKT